LPGHGPSIASPNSGAIRHAIPDSRAVHSLFGGGENWRRRGSLENFGDGILFVLWLGIEGRHCEKYQRYGLDDHNTEGTPA